jgi:hypothetical protein
MTGVKSFRVVVGLLPVLMVAASPANGPMSDVLMLVSPNEEAGGKFGISVSGAGDVNQDGFHDVIVGASGEDPGDSPNGAGRAYVFSGRDGSLLLELVSPNEAGVGEFGTDVSDLGDVNQDGIPDLLVGAEGESVGGRAYVLSGQDGSMLFAVVSPNAESSGQFGKSVAGADDVNLDGFADWIVGAEFEDPGNSPFNAGRAYVFSGRDGGLLHELVSPHEESSGGFGNSVDGAGDVNQDGAADLVVGARSEDGGQQDSGRAYVFSGVDGSVLLELVSPGPQELGRFGQSVAGADDVNQDGRPDVIVGTGEDDNDGRETGRVYVLSGHDGSLLLDLLSPNPNQLDVVAFGQSVAGAGDVDQDGWPDVLVASPSEFEGGRTYVFSGHNGALISELGLGAFVGAAGDVDQDGMADAVAGNPSDLRANVFLSPFALRINGGGRNYTDTSANVFAADRAYGPAGFGYAGGLRHTFDQPIGGTDDDPLYQDVRVARAGNGDGVFSYRFDVASSARYDVTLYIMAPALDSTGNVVMDVQAEEGVVFDDLDVTAEAGGEYQALLKTFAVDVNDGTLDLQFRAVNKAAVVSAIAVAAQAGARGSRVARRPSRVSDDVPRLQAPGG